MESTSNTEQSAKSKDSKHLQGIESKPNNMTAAKVQAKRSFRDFFHRREGKHIEKELPRAESKQSKRSSFAVPGSSFVSRFRSSANISKANLAKPAEAVTERQPVSTPETAKVNLETPVEAITERQPVTTPKTVKAPVQNADGHDMTSPLAEPATHSNVVDIVNSIMNRMETMPEESPYRLRALQIAEVCKTLHLRSLMQQELVLTVQNTQALLATVDACKQAEISAMEAKKHARDAALNAKKAEIALKRAQKLSELNSDTEALEAIKQLLKNAGMVGSEDQPSSSGMATLSE